MRYNVSGLPLTEFSAFNLCLKDTDAQFDTDNVRIGVTRCLTTSWFSIGPKLCATSFPGLFSAEESPSSPRRRKTLGTRLNFVSFPTLND